MGLVPLCSLDKLVQYISALAGSNGSPDRSGSVLIPSLYDV